jgi:hypothetical protein
MGLQRALVKQKRFNIVSVTNQIIMKHNGAEDLAFGLRTLRINQPIFYRGVS